MQSKLLNNMTTTTATTTTTTTPYGAYIMIKQIRMCMLLIKPLF